MKNLRQSEREQLQVDAGGIFEPLIARLRRLIFTSQNHFSSFLRFPPTPFRPSLSFSTLTALGPAAGPEHDLKLYHLFIPSSLDSTPPPEKAVGPAFEGKQERTSFGRCMGKPRSITRLRRSVRIFKFLRSSFFPVFSPFLRLCSLVKLHRYRQLNFDTNGKGMFDISSFPICCLLTRFVNPSQVRSFHTSHTITFVAESTNINISSDLGGWAEVVWRCDTREPIIFRMYISNRIIQNPKKPGYQNWIQEIVL